MLGRLPEARVATLSGFRDVDGNLLDQGIAIRFPGPHSFTGETVLELHGHGGPVVVAGLVEAVLRLGARRAALTRGSRGSGRHRRSEHGADAGDRDRAAVNELLRHVALPKT